MISINKKNMTVEFTPRAGFKHKPLTKKLIFAHICPVCNNVIQAFFETEEAVDLWPYEETRHMSFDVNGTKPTEFKHLVPGPKDPVGKTQYNIYYDGKTKSQKLTMKNHILKFSVIDVKGSAENADWEPGGKVCEMAGLFSLREDLLVRDWIFFSRVNVGNIFNYKASKVSDFKFVPSHKVCGTPVEAIGDAPPVLLLRYNVVNRGWENAIPHFIGHTEK